jgi:hypothetical protein
MKTRLTTIFTALIAPVLFAQDAAPTATPEAAQPLQPPAEAAAQPMPGEAPVTSGSTTLQSLAAPAPSQDSNLLFSEPNLESTAPATEGLPEMRPPDEADRMPAGGPTFRKTKTSESADELRQRIRVRQAKTKAIQDPRVQEALERADTARTLPERREAMRDYYNALYDRMVRIVPSIQKSVALLRKENLGRFDESRIGLAKKSAGGRRR